MGSCGPEVSFEEMLPKGVNQGARTDVISPKPVSGQCDKQISLTNVSDSDRFDMPPLKMSRSTVIKAPERVDMDRLGVWENMFAWVGMLTRNLKIRGVSNYDLREMYSLWRRRS